MIPARWDKYIGYAIGVLGIIAVYIIYQIYQKAKQGIGQVSAALDSAASTSGFNRSDGQNQPLVQYNIARVAFAVAQGYEPGSPEYIAPPGFPDEQTWLNQNAANFPGKKDSFWENFVNAL